MLSPSWPSERRLPQALRLAAERLKRTTNTKLYAEVTRELGSLEQDSKVTDPVWVEATDQHAAQSRGAWLKHFRAV